MASVETVAALLRELREARRMSLSEAARRAEVSRASLQNWEAGRHTPPGPALERLLDALQAEAGTRMATLTAADPAHARRALAGAPVGPPIGAGAILRAMRLRRGMTQWALAEAVGATQGTVAKWEAGDGAPAEEARARLIVALGATPEEAAALGIGETDDRMHTPEDELRRWMAIFESGRQDGSSEVGYALEPLLLAHEAEVWEMAVRDPRWEPTLVRVMGQRALFLSDPLGRLSEAVELGVRALRLAKRCGAWNDAMQALLAVAYVPSMPVASMDPLNLPEMPAHFPRDFERIEEILARMTDPNMRSIVRMGSVHHMVLGELSPTAMDEMHRREMDQISSSFAPGRTVMFPVFAASRMILAYYDQGRFDDADRLLQSTPWSETPAWSGSYRRRASAASTCTFTTASRRPPTRSARSRRTHPGTSCLLRCSACPTASGSGPMNGRSGGAKPPRRPRAPSARAAGGGSPARPPGR